MYITNKYMYIHKQVHVYTQTSTCIYTNKYMYIHKQEHVYTQTSTCIYTNKYMYNHKQVHVYTRTSTCIYTNVLNCRLSHWLPLLGNRVRTLYIHVVYTCWVYGIISSVLCQILNEQSRSNVRTNNNQKQNFLFLHFIESRFYSWTVPTCCNKCVRC